MPPSPQLPGASTEPRPVVAGGADFVLVRRAITGGDQAAVEEVLARLSCVVRFVFRLNRALGYGLTTDTLEDVVQQVYASMWPRLRDFHGGATIESWAFGFCRNCLRAEVRKRRNRARLAPMTGDGDAGLEERVAERGATPDRVASRREGLDALRDELDRLVPEERHVVELRFFEDWSFERIARELEIAPSTVKDRCYRALTRMKERLRKRDVDV